MSGLRRLGVCAAVVLAVAVAVIVAGCGGSSGSHTGTGASASHRPAAAAGQERRLDQSSRARLLVSDRQAAAECGQRHATAWAAATVCRSGSGG